MQTIEVKAVYLETAERGRVRDGLVGEDEGLHLEVARGRHLAHHDLEEVGGHGHVVRADHLVSAIIEKCSIKLGEVISLGPDARKERKKETPFDIGERGVRYRKRHKL